MFLPNFTLNNIYTSSMAPSTRPVKPSWLYIQEKQCYLWELITNSVENEFDKWASLSPNIKLHVLNVISEFNDYVLPLLASDCFVTQNPKRNTKKNEI